VTTKDASNVGTTSARMNGEVTSTGGANPTVKIYWGDNDGGTGSWDHVENLGAKGAGTFSKTVSGLSHDTTYYYRCHAENAAGGTWASSSKSFRTQPNMPPVCEDKTVSVIEGGTVSITLTYSDPDGGPSPYTVEVVSGPSDGTLSGSGTVYTYTPDSGFSGVDTFTYRARDNMAWGATATVTINVESDSDGDGLPDSWESQYGLNPNSIDSDGDGTTDDDEDEDDDGWTNLEEYRAGYDPTVADAPGGGEANILSCGQAAAGGAGPGLVIVAALLLLALRARAVSPGRRAPCPGCRRARV
jgi:hypothetical protein